MKYLIVEPRVKSKAPNIALLKWCRWCEQNNHEYIYVKGRIDINEYDYIPDVILISMIFTYYADIYEKTVDFYIKKYPNVKIRVGGVFPTLFPDWFDKQKWKGNSFFGTQDVIEVHQGMCCEIEDIPPKYNIDIMYEDEVAVHDSLDTIVMYASRGCVNKCAYCAVPRLEGSMHSFKSIKDTLTLAKEEMPNARSVVLYDNNFTEHEYFDQIVDELVEFGLPVDIHGLHVDSFDKHKAEQFARLKWQAQSASGTSYLRFSFDKLKYADHIERALILVRDAKIKASFFCYMLFNFTDRPEDFWWRIQKTQEIVDRVGKTIFLFPQRYEPFKSLKRNSYIGKHWDENLVRGLVKLFTFYGHGFIPITKSRNIYKWLGNSYEDFIKNIKSMV
jgi:hypothetical protein